MKGKIVKEYQKKLNRARKEIEEVFPEFVRNLTRLINAHKMLLQSQWCCQCEVLVDHTEGDGKITQTGKDVLDICSHSTAVVMTLHKILAHILTMADVTLCSDTFPLDFRLHDVLRATCDVLDAFLNEERAYHQ